MTDAGILTYSEQLELKLKNFEGNGRYRDGYGKDVYVGGNPIIMD